MKEKSLFYDSCLLLNEIFAIKMTEIYDLKIINCMKRILELSNIYELSIKSIFSSLTFQKRMNIFVKHM